MNKKLLLIDAISFIIGVILLILLKLLYIVSTDSTVTTVSFVILSVTVAIISMLFVYANRFKGAGVINIISGVAFLILFYVIYLIPFFGFIGVKGVHNSICLAFMFLFGAKFAIYVYFFIKEKVGIIHKSYKTINSKNQFNFYKIIGVFGICFFCAGIFGAIFNAFMPVIDMSIPYRMLIFNEPMAQLMNI